MSAQKNIFSLAFLVAALLAINSVSVSGFVNNYAAANNKSHHLIVGYRMPGDKLVLTKNVVKNSSWLRIQVIEETFHVPYLEQITMMQALDQKTNGNGAYASLLQGGPGHNNVTIKFKSQRSHGINFVVNLYSRR